MVKFVYGEKRMEEIYEKVVKIISGTCNIDMEKIDVNTNLYEDLEIDSIMILDIVCLLEKEWKFSLTDYPQLLDNMETVGSLVTFLEKSGLGE